MAEVPVEKIGRYQILEVLGKGAMGVVYRAEDPTIGRHVALKTTRLDVAGLESDEMLRRFRQEARAAGVLNHPNIVTVYDAGEADGLFYMAMEMIRGVTLQELLVDKRPLAPNTIVDVMSQVCTGLEYAHKHGIVHRDLKPANIMIAPGGTVKIMDFGIAKMGAGMTTQGQVLGTPSYMSPEQVRGALLDGRSDLFSVGVILYECVTGQKPFPGENVTTIVYKIIGEDPRPPRELNANLHPRLGGIVSKALSKNLNERFQSGTELAEALLAYKAETEPLEPGDATDNYAADAAHAVVASTGGASSSMSVTPVPATPPVKQLPAKKPVGGPPPPAKVPGFKPQPQPAAAPKLVHPPHPPVSARRVPAWVFVAIGAVVLLLGGGLWMRRAQLDTQTTLNGPATDATPAPAAVTPPKSSATHKAGTATPSDAAPNPAAPPVAPPVDAAPAPGSVSVALDSIPHGANVEVDGRSVGVTPLRYPLLPKAYIFTFRKDGYADKKVEQQINADNPNPSIIVTLKTTSLPAAPVVKVTSNPDGATILLDGKNTGKTTPADITVDAGSAHTFKVQKQGYRTVESPLPHPLKAGERFALTAGDLEKEGGFFKKIGKALSGGGDKGFVNVASKPTGAEVLFDGASLGKTPLQHHEVKTGSHQLSLKKKNCETLTRTIAVEGGKTLDTNETLTCKK